MKFFTGIKNWHMSFGVLLVLAFVLRLVLIFLAGYHPDILNHVDWGNRFWLYGPRRFYESSIWGVSWPNQPPGSIYLFAVIAKIYHGLFAALWWLNLKVAVFPSFIFPFLEAKLHIILLKTPFIIADLGIGWLIYKVVHQLSANKSKALLGASLFLFNPALIYNSAIWGQTDSLINFLALLGLWWVYRRKYFWGILSFTLSLYFKLSLIIWLPAFFLLVPSWKFWRKILLSVVTAILIAALMSWPFVSHGNIFSWLWYLYTNRVLARQGSMLSGNAFNFWTLFYGIDLSLRENSRLYGMSAKMIGRVVGLAIITAVSGLSWIKAERKNKIFGMKDALWLVLLISFAAFLFLTNMHERYLYPVFAPLSILVAVGEVGLSWYIILALIHWLNLYNLWWYPHWQRLENILQMREFLLPRVLSLILILIFVRLCLFAYNKGNEKT